MQHVEEIVSHCNPRGPYASRATFTIGNGYGGMFDQPKIHVWDDEMLKEGMGAAAPFAVIVATLRACGFRMHKDAHTHKHYRSLSPGTRAGERGRARVKVEHHGRSVELKIYADPNPTHTYPEHGHDVFQHLPYLDGVRVRWALALCAAGLREIGLIDVTVPPLTPLERVEYDARTSGHWRSDDRSIFDRPTFFAERFKYWPKSQRDDDGNELHDGDWRAFYSYRGRLQYGRVFSDLNGGWVGVTNEDWFRNIHSYEIFTPKPGERSRRCSSRRARERLERVLAERVKAQDFERAIPVRDLLRANGVRP